MAASRLRAGLLVAGITLVLTAAFTLVRLTHPEAVSVTLSPHPAFAASGGIVTSVADVAEKVVPSVVNISSSRKVPVSDSPFGQDPVFRDFFRGHGPHGPRERQERGMGSGIIFSADGIVVTNNHVVANADVIRVTTSDKREFEGKVVGTDAKSDLAVIRLKGAKGLKPFEFGDSGKLRLGDLVLAVGNPFGVGQTVTMGIVSAKGRANVGIVDYEDFIQTDAAINPGNSGGALVNLRGELVGINTAILSRSGGYQGIGFAIPTNMVRPIVTSLLKSGKVVRGWAGVIIQEVDQELAKAMKLPTTRGVLISDVDPRGPAHKAGLQRGDLVVKINGQTVDSTGALRNLVAASGAGAKVTVEYYRGNALKNLPLTLGELPSNLGGTGAVVGGTGQSGGMSLAPINPLHRKKFSLPERLTQGVIIERVDANSAAAMAGLQPGDVILELNRVTINSVSRFQQLYAAARGRVLVLVYRQGSAFYLLLPKP